jgi:hypothetical protein
LNAVKKAIFKTVAKTAGSMTQPFLLEIGILNKSFYRKFGKESLPVIIEIMSQDGVKAGESVRERMGAAHNMKDISSFFEIVEALLGVKMERVEVTERVFHCRMSKCPYGIEGTSRELCEAMMTKDAKQVSALLGQEAKVEIIKTVAAGDKQCDMIFTLK